MKNAEVLQSLPAKNIAVSRESRINYSTIYVFKTNVTNYDEGRAITKTLLSYFPGSEISFDLGDCDRILRIKHYGNFATLAIGILNQHGFDCEELLD